MDDENLLPEVLEGKAARALEAARHRAGLNVDEMVRRLRPSLRMREAPPGKRVSQNWYDWRSSPRSIPAVALLASAEIAETTVDALLSGASQSRDDAVHMAQLERRLAQLEALFQVGGKGSEEGGDDVRAQRGTGSASEQHQDRLERIEQRLDTLMGVVVRLQEAVKTQIELSGEGSHGTSEEVGPSIRDLPPLHTGRGESS